MKKYIFGLLAVMIALSSCKKDNNGISFDQKALAGKWKLATLDGKPVQTNQRTIYTFDGVGAGTQTMADFMEVMGEQVWFNQKKLNYTLQGDALHTRWSDGSIRIEWMANITSMSDKQFTTDPSRMFKNDDPEKDMMPKATFEKVYVDYTEDIIGLWQGTSGGGDYGDYNHLWLMTPEGKYYYFSPDSIDPTQWVISENTLNEYAVDGDFVAFRWKESPAANEDREWWDITIQDKQMAWTALRDNNERRDFTMARISPTRDEVNTMLPGKWMAVKENGAEVFTNKRSVHTFDNNGNVFYTIADTTFSKTEWHNKLQLKYSLTGNYLVESGKDNTGALVQWRSSITALNNTSIRVIAYSSSRDGKAVDPQRMLELVKVNEDFSEAIQGKWYGIAGSGAYGDYHHIWEYLNDGTYYYYNDSSATPGVEDWKRQGFGQPNDGLYGVDGNWLVTSWENNGQFFEWWDIEIKKEGEETIMEWSGYRENGDRNTFKMKKIPAIPSK